ncbi:putative peroxidase [Dioscorea sansibarensis]
MTTWLLLDLVTGNNYFRNLTKKKGLLHSDQVRFNGGSTDDIVASYSKDKATFYSDLACAPW